jgi:hypothetical protein
MNSCCLVGSQLFQLARSLSSTVRVVACSGPTLSLEEESGVGFVIGIGLRARRALPLVHLF